MAEENGNGRATIREVYQLVQDARSEILKALNDLSDKNDDRFDKQDEKHESLRSTVTKLWVAVGSLAAGLSIAVGVDRLFDKA